MGNLDRYSRQIAFEKMGRAGQEKLGRSTAVIFGMGALGTVIAESLCRAGAGRIRLVDRDIVTLSNLQRQALYTESDARQERPKSLAAADSLARINAAITLEPVIADITAANIEELLLGADIALDGSDNFELRLLLNEACVKRRLPWIYGGAIAATGGSMNILEGGPCFRCLVPEPPAPGSYPTCASEGILNMVTGIIGCVEAAEAVKILTGSAAVSKQYLSIDVWENTVDQIRIVKNPDCPVCGRGEYSMLENPGRGEAVAFCGQDAVQVSPAAGTTINLEAAAERLARSGEVQYTPFMLKYRDAKTNFYLFEDGRAIIKQVTDTGAAKSIYAEYIGQ
ncbi:MAG: ThiF family adenylyltransferase [Treponema sp.]|jgi:adenylyltransferase/sulfurtransferase|nr:ThiF family adenylyltransferase [Treponema sp.]